MQLSLADITQKGEKCFCNTEELQKSLIHVTGQSQEKYSSTPKTKNSHKTTLSSKPQSNAFSFNISTSKIPVQILKNLFFF